MDLYERIQNAINFIDDNLTDDFSLNEVAGRAYCSLSYFHYVFHGVVGSSLKDYIRKRRIAAAAYELISTKEKILDIALRYRYESSEAFTRAFTKMLGVTPSSYRKNNKHQMYFQKVNLFLLKMKHLEEGFIMEPKIIDKEEMNVIGIELKTSFDSPDFSASIKKLWDNYLKNNIGAQIPSQSHPAATLGLNMDFDSNGGFSYLIGKEVDNLSVIPTGMVGKTIPKTKYAVFTAQGKSKNEIGVKLGQVWNYFFETWLPSSGYTQAGLSASGASSPYDEEAAANFELYDERFEMEPFEVDVYIPIR